MDCDNELSNLMTSDPNHQNGFVSYALPMFTITKLVGSDQSRNGGFYKVLELCLCNDTPSGVQSGADIGDFELLELLLGKNSSSGGISRAADIGNF